MLYMLINYVTSYIVINESTIKDQEPMTRANVLYKVFEPKKIGMIY